MAVENRRLLIRVGFTALFIGAYKTLSPETALAQTTTSSPAPQSLTERYAQSNRATKILIGIIMSGTLASMCAAVYGAGGKNPNS